MLTCFSILTSGCQVFKKGRTPKPGKHYKNSQLQKFEGDWKNFEGSDSTVLRLTFTKYLSPETGAYFDALKSELTYQEFNVNKNAPIKKTLQLRPNLSMKSLGKGKMKVYRFTYFFYDFIKEKNGFAYLEFKSKKDTVALWRLQNTERILINGEKFDRTWSIPDSLYLTKVKE